MEYTPSREDYLIAIYLLREKNGFVRSVDVAQMLGFTKSSVSSRIRFLAKHGLVEMDEKKLLVLTPAGEARAKEIYARYSVVLRFLRDVLGIAPERAHEDASRIEHVVSEETLEKLEAHLEESINQKLIH